MPSFQRAWDMLRAYRTHAFVILLVVRELIAGEHVTSLAAESQLCRRTKLVCCLLFLVGRPDVSFAVVRIITSVV